MSEESKEEIFVQTSSRESDWYSEFASRLLRDNFLLTALEFHAELVEAGKELPKLKDFFSNPSNFEQQAVNRPEVILDLPRSSSQATLDSLDFARFSEDGERSCDEKVAVLEFELRKARETISALRANLTIASESANNSNANIDDVDTGPCDRNVHTQVDIRPYEQRALNFLINEYLLRYGYKLTSITFADENERQDFDDWDDVGLNTSRPRELLLLYREGLKATKAADTDVRDAACQAVLFDEEDRIQHINALENELVAMKERIGELESERNALLEKLNNGEDEQIGIVEVRSHESVTPDQDLFELIEDCKSRGSSESKSIQSNGDWTKISDTQTEVQTTMVEVKEQLYETNNDIVDGEKLCQKQVDDIQKHLLIPREIPDAFKTQILKTCDIGFSTDRDVLLELLEGTELIDLNVQRLVEILSLYLQKIIPNVILNKREDVIPLLVLTICLCPDSNTRDKLLTILFNLKKRPQEEERRHILKALITISKTVGPAITEAEVLPQCWEQIGHKYLERRLLVAESCFVLAPFVSEAMRHSLILSMIQQLINDREDSIRHASVSCLALLVTLISEPDKLPQLCDITLDLLMDKSTSVSQQVSTILLPALAQWSSSLRRLQTELLEKMLVRLSQNPSVFLLHGLEALLPYLVMFVASSETVNQHLSENHPKAIKRQEFANLCKGLYDPLLFFSGSVGTSVSAFDYLTTDLEVSSDWPELDWIMNRLLPVLLHIAANNLENESLIRSLSLYLRHFCAGMGKNITCNLVKPELSRRLETCSAGLLTNEVTHLEMIPMYLVGVLSLDAKVEAGREELEATLFKFICALPLCGSSLQPLSIAIDCLSRMDPLRAVVMDSLWSGVVYNRPVVRSAAAFLFQSAIGHLPEHFISSRVVPALVTLASDPEISVRLAVIPALGMLADASEKQTRDKVAMTFQSILQDGASSGNQVLILQILKTLVECYEKFEPPFRNEVVLPQLVVLSASCEANKNNELAKALTEVLSVVTFSQSQLPTQTLASCILPSLRSLEAVSRQMDSAQAERLESLLRHAERLLPSTPETSTRPSIGEPGALSPGVEDVKNRVAKIFSSRPQSLQNVSGIFKKKI